jgi:Icc-related predicted phosphoesterase
MRLLVFSDIHNDWAALRRLMTIEADHYIAAGDMVSWARGLDDAGAILRERADRMHVLPGNHEHASDIARLCDKFGLNPLHGQSFEADGWRVAGLGHSNPTPFHTAGEETEAELAAHLNVFAGLMPLVLICHCPPLGTALDEAGPGRHFGSSAVREFIDQRQPEHFCCGHIHEAAGREAMIGRTKGVNAGKNGYLLELPSYSS